MLTQSDDCLAPPGQAGTQGPDACLLGTKSQLRRDAERGVGQKLKGCREGVGQKLKEAPKKGHKKPAPKGCGEGGGAQKSSSKGMQGGYRAKAGRGAGRVMGQKLEAPKGCGEGVGQKLEDLDRNHHDMTAMMAAINSTKQKADRNAKVYARSHLLKLNRTASNPASSNLEHFYV